MLPLPASLRVAPSTLINPEKPKLPVKVRAPPLILTVLDSGPEITPAKLSVARPLSTSNTFPSARSTRPAPDKDWIDVKLAVCGAARSSIPPALIRIAALCSASPVADSVLSRPDSIDMFATLASPDNESAPAPALVSFAPVTAPEMDASPVVLIFMRALLLAVIFAAWNVPDFVLSPARSLAVPTSALKEISPVPASTLRLDVAPAALFTDPLNSTSPCVARLTLRSRTTGPEKVMLDCVASPPLVASSPLAV